MKITWIASYPKSGNTWVRFFLYHYLYGELGQSIDLNARIPDIHRNPQFDPKAPGSIMVKTHFAYGPNLPLASQTERAVHIIRNPRDVLLSGLNYSRLNRALSAADPKADQRYARMFVRFGGEPGWVQMGFGTWEAHAQSWSDTTFPVLHLRYEEMRAEPARHMRALVEFLEGRADEDRLARAIEASSFESMQRREIDEKKQGAGESLFRGSADDADKGVLFVNKGKTGQSLDHLGRDIADAFDEKFASAMQRFGYDG